MGDHTGMNMGRREMLRKMGRAAAGAMAFSLADNLGATAAEDRRKPNIIFMLADDLGYGDLSCYGSKIVDTPNIDRLAAQGVLLSQFYVSTPLCAPTRVSFLTGKYPQRTSLAWNPNFKNMEDGLSPDEVTIAELLGKAGYKTGLVGKWHLGYGEKFRPRKQGFQEFYGFLSGWSDYYTHTYNEGSKWWFKNDEPLDEPGYATDLFTREAISFIDRHKDEPFFLYLAYNAPHSPQQAPKKWLERSKHGVFGAMVGALDDSVGKVIQHLDALGLSRDTLVVFAGDNGDDGRGSNAPLSGGKGNLWEGGIRVPFIARWPGHIPAGKVVTAPIISMDMFATFANVAGVRIPKSLNIDGANGLATLKGDGGATHRFFFWQYGKQAAVRHGNMKLLREQGKADRLFDVVNDPGEQTDLAAKHPELVQTLGAKLEEWLAGLKTRS